jgi:DNA-directed RNA polymerase subunit N (RpoN/RPB10)
VNSRRPIISPVRCASCGFPIAAAQPITTRVGDDKRRTLIVTHQGCV